MHLSDSLTLWPACHIYSVNRSDKYLFPHFDKMHESCSHGVKCCLRCLAEFGNPYGPMVSDPEPETRPMRVVGPGRAWAFSFIDLLARLFISFHLISLLFFLFGQLPGLYFLRVLERQIVSVALHFETAYIHRGLVSGAAG
ncbi:hypothetical protein BDV09DRAFT_59295 [Aspergillus tetrazonus]